MRKYIAYAVLVILVVICLYTYNNMVDQGDFVYGKIIEKLGTYADEEAYVTINTYDVKILNGKYKNMQIQVEENINDMMSYSEKVGVGTEVVLGLEMDDTTGEIENSYIMTTRKDNYIIFLVIIFMFLIVIIGGFKGFKSLIALILTILAIFYVLLPKLLAGGNPILWSSFIAFIIAVFTMTIVSGFNKKTLAAIMGTLGGVLIGGFIAMGIGHVANLTGVSMDEAQYLAYIPQGTKFDFRGLLFGSIILGSMGAIMDVGMSIASSIIEIENTDKTLGIKPLFKSGMNIGKDIMGTMTNTLILAYIGSAVHFTLILMAYETSIMEILNNDLIATEIVRALSGTIGLLFAIPITAIIAASFGKLRKKNLETNKEDNA